MEPLWSPVVATGGNQPQTDRARRRRKQAKSVATVCHQWPEKFHGKEGVDGSSPSEGSANAPQKEVFCIRAGLHSRATLTGARAEVKVRSVLNHCRPARR